MMSVVTAMRKFGLMMAVLFSMGFAMSATAAAASATPVVDHAVSHVTADTHFYGEGGDDEVDCELQPNHPDCQ